MEGPKLFFNPLVKQLIDSFSFCFDVKITFYSLNLEEWLVGYHSAASDYCTMIQSQLKIRYRCLHQDTSMCQRCNKLKRQFSYRCHGGLTEAVFPIIMDGGLVAFAMIGQFRMTDTLPSDMLNRWKSAGFDEKALKKAFFDRPFFSSERLEKMLYIFSTTLFFLINTQNMAIRKTELVERVLSYVDAHMSEPISIEEVSQALGKSSSTITHTLKNKLDLSFKQLVISQKLMRFDRLIMHDPDLPIMQASRMVGYDDALYFSRLYHSKRFSTPSEFVQMVKQSRQMNELDTSLFVP